MITELLSFKPRNVRDLLHANICRDFLVHIRGSLLNDTSAELCHISLHRLVVDIVTDFESVYGLFGSFLDCLLDQFNFLDGLVDE